MKTKTRNIIIGKTEHIREMKLSVPDEMGYIKEELTNLEGRMKELKKKAMEEIIPTEGEVSFGNEYKIEHTTRVNRTLDTNKIQKVLGKGPQFLKVITISMTKIKQYLSDEDIDNCTKSTKVSSVITIKKTEKA